MIQTVVHIIAYDIWFYISHLILHTPSMYWIHSKHHEKRQPKFLDTYYGHTLESVFQGLGFLLPFALKMTDPSDVAAALIILNIKGMMRHDERTGHLIDNNHHLLHHLESRNNFGEPWLDMLFGTYRPWPKAPTTQSRQSLQLQ